MDAVSLSHAFFIGALVFVGFNVAVLYLVRNRINLARSRVVEADASSKALARKGLKT